MSVSYDILPYTPDLLHITGQIIQEIVTAPPLNEISALSDVLAKYQSDSTRDGFGGYLLKVNGKYAGASAWFDVSGRELNDRWRPRFSPREHVPTPSGRGVLLSMIAVLPRYQRHGLGRALLARTLETVEASRDWIALNTLSEEPHMLALLRDHDFDVLPLSSPMSKGRLCLIKWVRQAEVIP